MRFRDDPSATENPWVAELLRHGTEADTREWEAGYPNGMGKHPHMGSYEARMKPIRSEAQQARIDAYRTPPVIDLTPGADVEAREREEREVEGLLATERAYGLTRRISRPWIDAYGEWERKRRSKLSKFIEAHSLAEITVVIAVVFLTFKFGVTAVIYTALLIALTGAMLYCVLCFVGVILFFLFIGAQGLIRRAARLLPT
jgi:hypothetical protein